MPGNVRPVADERDGLLAYLAHMRHVLRLSAFGLTDDEARTRTTASTLTVGGLIKHVSVVEAGWVDTIMQRPPGNDADDYFANFALAPDETLAGVLDRYEAVAKHTEATIDAIDDLGQAVPVPKDVPWFPADIDAWSVRWVLLHLIHETARHAGHADIIRESLDGGTAFPLMAAAENWPETPWMKPWSRAAPPAME